MKSLKDMKGLGERQMAVLLYLIKHPEEDNWVERPKWHRDDFTDEDVHVWRCYHAGLSQTLRTLEDRGLIERPAIPASTIHLTKKGEDVAKTLRKIEPDFENDWFMPR